MLERHLQREVVCLRLPVCANGMSISNKSPVSLQPDLLHSGPDKLSEGIRSRSPAATQDEALYIGISFKQNEPFVWTEGIWSGLRTGVPLDESLHHLSALLLRETQRRVQSDEALLGLLVRKR